MTRKRVALVLGTLTAILAIALVGCAGSADRPPDLATEGGQICGALAAWQDAVDAVADRHSRPYPSVRIAEQALDEALSDIQVASRRLRAHLLDVGAGLPRDSQMILEDTLRNLRRELRQLESASADLLHQMPDGSVRLSLDLAVVSMIVQAAIAVDVLLSQRDALGEEITKAEACERFRTN